MKYLSLVFLLFVITACPPPDKVSEKPKEEAVKATETIKADEVTYTSDGVNLKGYIVYDGSVEGKRPGVLVVHEWWGHNEYARERARKLAKLGYTALAVDMYGEGKKTEHPEDANKFMTEVFKNMPTAEARFNAAIEVLKNQPTVDPEKIAAIGYCFGGAVVLHMARVGTDLDGVVSFHGNLASMHKPQPGSVKAKVLVCNGADDPWSTQELKDAFNKEMVEAQVDYQFIDYEGAAHSFTNPSADKFGEQFELPLKYNAAADAKSWQDMQNFFNKIFSD